MHFSSSVDLPSEGPAITSGDARIDRIPAAMRVITALFQEQAPVDLPSELRQDLVQSVDALVDTILGSAWRDAEADDSEGAHTAFDRLARHFQGGDTPPATPAADWDVSTARYPSTAPEDDDFNEWDVPATTPTRSGPPLAGGTGTRHQPPSAFALGSVLPREALVLPPALPRSAPSGLGFPVRPS